MCGLAEGRLIWDSVLRIYTTTVSVPQAPYYACRLLTAACCLRPRFDQERSSGHESCVAAESSKVRRVRREILLYLMRLVEGTELLNWNIKFRLGLSYVVFAHQGNPFMVLCICTI